MRTKVETTYICEICGAEFNDEEECLNHEIRERLLLECRFWNSDRDELKIEDWDCSSDAVFFFYAPTEEHFMVVNNWFEDGGFETAKNIEPEDRQGLFLYENGWENLDNKISSYQVLKAWLMEG